MLSHNHPCAFSPPANMTADATTCSSTTGGFVRSCAYVKENDIKLGVSPASRKLHSGVLVNELRCCFCLTFFAKRKSATLGKSWTAPFRYDNIETHMKFQHASKWSEYEAAKETWWALCTTSSSRIEQSDLFFAATKNSAVNSNGSSVKDHFQAVSPPSPSSRTMPPITIVIDKDIVDVIIGDMYYSAPTADVLANQEGDEQGEEDADGISTAPACFGSAAEYAAVQNNRLEIAAQMKMRALAVFKKEKLILIDYSEEHQEDEAENASGRADEEDDDDSISYQYVVTMPRSKGKLMNLVLRYISCGVTFRMIHSILQRTAEVFGSARTMSCSRGDISMMARVACASNLQKISVILQKSWAFSIAIDSATHQSTSYLDLRFRVYSKGNRDIHNLHGCVNIGW